MAMHELLVDAAAAAISINHNSGAYLLFTHHATMTLLKTHLSIRTMTRVIYIYIGFSMGTVLEKRFHMHILFTFRFLY